MKPYRLVLSLRSPFARRVRLALLRLDVPFEEDVINVFEPPAWLFERSPLGLVPILTTPEGKHLPDSNTILECLHETLGGRVWPADPRLRLEARAASALAAGIMTATVAHFLETERPAPDQSWKSDHRGAVERSLERARAMGLSGEPWLVGDTLTQAGWDLAVALEYLSLRMPEVAWRGLDPGFDQLLAAARGFEPFARTTPPA